MDCLVTVHIHPVLLPFLALSLSPSLLLSLPLFLLVTAAIGPAPLSRTSALALLSGSSAPPARLFLSHTFLCADPTILQDRHVFPTSVPVLAILLVRLEDVHLERGKSADEEGR